MLQYPLGNELSYWSGKIISIENNIIRHTSATQIGSSGSLIISRYSNSSIIGLHYGSYENKYNVSRVITSIISDIKSKNNNNKNKIKINIAIVK